MTLNRCCFVALFLWVNLPVQERNKYVTFQVKHGNTKLGESYYVVGNVPELGEWDIARAIKMECGDNYPTWTAEHILIHDKWHQDVCFTCVLVVFDYQDVILL